MNNFQHSTHIVLNIEEGHENGGQFYYTPENEVKVNDNRHTCDLGVINVPVRDPNDAKYGLYKCACDNRHLYIMMPKVSKCDLNTNAIYDKVDKNVFPSTGHAAFATPIKNHYKANNIAALVDVIVVDAGASISNKFGNDKELKNGTIIKPSTELKPVDFVNGNARILEPHSVTINKYLDEDDSNSKIISLSTIRFRFTFDDSIKAICPELHVVNDALTQLTVSAQDTKVIPDNQGV